MVNDFRNKIRFLGIINWKYIEQDDKHKWAKINSYLLFIIFYLEVRSL